MKNIIIIVVLILSGWYGHQLYKQQRLPFFQDSSTYSKMEGELKCITKDGRTIYGKVPEGTTCERLVPIKGSLAIIPGEPNAPNNNNNNINSNSNSNSNHRKSANSKCDGRTYCSEMRSCAEAKFFLRNCPDTKMDGDGDGIPCESQWCGH